MSPWLKILEGNPDHPMFNVDEARKLLADLPQDNPINAVDEITGWLVSVKDTPGFRPERRADIFMLLDETALPFYTQLMQLYLVEAHLQDFKGSRMWQGIHDFTKALTEAYALSVEEFQQEEKKSSSFKEKIPVICVRLLRAITQQMELELMRYVKIEQSAWSQLYQYYNFAEANEFADTMVFAYSMGNTHTSSQRELLRAVLLYVASPATLAPDEIEVSYRIAARLSSFFDFKTVPDADCTYCLDLAHPAAPVVIDDKIQVTPTMRFFGAVKTVPQLEEILNETERSLTDQKQRLDREFTPNGKLTVLKHLQVYWSKDHPFRRQDRRGINASIEVIHGFKIISKLVKNSAPNLMTNLSEEDALQLKEESKINLTDAEEDVDYVAKKWEVLDLSIGGMGGVVPKAAGDWVKIGALCGIKPTNSDVWWVGMIRRLQTDLQGKIHFGIEIIAKKPLTVWLRSLGNAGKVASGTGKRSESFKYTYLPAILVPVENDSYENATLLMESGGYRPGYIYEAMVSGENNHIKLMELLAEGADYEHIHFQWINSANSVGT